MNDLKSSTSSLVKKINQLVDESQKATEANLSQEEQTYHSGRLSILKELLDFINTNDLLNNEIALMYFSYLQGDTQGQRQKVGAKDESNVQEFTDAILIRVDRSIT